MLSFADLDALSFSYKSSSLFNIVLDCVKVQDVWSLIALVINSNKLVHK